MVLFQRERPDVRFQREIRNCPGTLSTGEGIVINRSFIGGFIAELFGSVLFSTVGSFGSHAVLTILFIKEDSNQ